MIRILLLSGLVTFGGLKRTYYTVNHVYNPKVSVEEGKHVLTFQLPPETLYYSPGLMRSTYNGKRAYLVAKCPIQRRCKAHVTSSFKKGVHRVVLEDTEPVTLMDHRGKKKDLPSP